ncbi:MAG: GNAT family N-acetyltransferase, partial [Bordetella sp.]|nr:GNAT family N-acetyltransferase [Bordetella sp.]
MNAPLPLTPTVLVRDTIDADLPAIAAIYAQHVLHGTASFELEPPSEAEMRQRHATVIGHGLPYLTAECGGAVVGYAPSLINNSQPTR